MIKNENINHQYGYKPTIECNKQARSSANQIPQDHSLYCDFPVIATRIQQPTPGPIFEKHWHQQLQILYFEQGEALINCNTNTYTLIPGDIMIINSNEIHYGVTDSEDLVYYIVKVDLNCLLSNQEHSGQIAYITPLLQGRIRFQNQISQDPQLSAETYKIMNEYIEKNLGYEWAIKSHIYNILVYLLRNYQLEILQPAEQERQQKALYQLHTALQYMDDHYNETIRLSELASLANMSSQHFCRLFKMMTGKRPMDYINFLRINKAVTLLSENRFNISEVAMAVGFDDSNYFSRIFKKYKKISPSALRK